MIVKKKEYRQKPGKRNLCAGCVAVADPNLCNALNKENMCFSDEEQTKPIIWEEVEKE